MTESFVFYGQCACVDGMAGCPGPHTMDQYQLCGRPDCDKRHVEWKGKLWDTIGHQGVWITT